MEKGDMQTDRGPSPYRDAIHRRRMLRSRDLWCHIRWRPETFTWAATRQRHRLQ